MKRAITIIILLLCFFATKITAANVEITNISIESKTDYIYETKNATIDNLNIDYNLKFEDFEQNIIYKITLKNNTGYDYNYYLSLNDSYIKYEIIDEEQTINSKSTKNVFLKVSYNEEIDQSLYHEDTYNIQDKIELILTGPEVKGIIEEILNGPKTGLFFNYGLTILIITIGTILYFKTKRISLFKYNIILLLLISPIIVLAKDNKIVIKMNFNIEIIKPKIAILGTGGYVNSYFRYASPIENVRRIALSDSTKEGSQELQAEESEYPIYVWYESDDNTIYMYSEANRLYYNPDSSNLYGGMRSLEDIYLLKGNILENTSVMFREVGYNVENFNLDLTGFNVKNVKNSTQMFLFMAYNSTTANVTLDNWEFYNIENIDQMFVQSFYNCDEANININNWKIIPKNTIEQSGPLFQQIASYSNKATININNLYIDNFTKISALFSMIAYWGKDLKLNIEGFKAPNNKDYSALLYNIMGSYDNVERNNLYINVSKWDTSNVENMTSLFANTGANVKHIVIEGLDDWDVSNVKSLQQAFDHMAWYNNPESLEIKGYENWDVSNVENMSGMFHFIGYYAKSLTVNIDISNWNTSNLTNPGGMFNEVSEYGGNVKINASGLDLSKSTNGTTIMSSTGFNAKNIDVNLDNLKLPENGQCSTVVSYLGNTPTFSVKFSAKNWDVRNCTTNTPIYAVGMFSTQLEWDLSGWKLGKNTYLRQFFSSLHESTFNDKDQRYKHITLKDWDFTDREDVSALFSNTFYDSKEVIFDVSGWEMPNVTNMSNMFNYAFVYGGNDSSINIIGLEDWDVSSVTNMESMFYTALQSCNSDLSLDLSKWNVSSVTNMKDMFNHTLTSFNKVSLNISNWDISNVTNLENMFTYVGSNSTEFNLIGANAININSNANTDNMFSGIGQNCTTTVLDFSNLNLSSVSNMNIFSGIGQGTNNATINLSNVKLNTNISEEEFYKFIRLSDSFKDKYSSHNVISGNYSINYSGININELSNITSFEELFKDAFTKVSGQLTINLSDWDTSRITNMTNIFDNIAPYATELNIIGANNWTT